MIDVLTDGKTIQDGIWRVEHWSEEPCMWSLGNIKDVRASVYDYAPKLASRIKEAEEILKELGPSWQSNYDAIKEQSDNYEIWISKEFSLMNMEGTDIHITRNSKLSKSQHTLEQAKEFLLKEVEKISKIRVEA
jgi:hypothetical protein